MPSVSGNAQFCSLPDVLHCSLASVRRDRADSSQIAFLSSAMVCGFPLYTRDFRYPHIRKSGGFRSGDLAGQGCGVLREITRVPKHSWMSLMVSCAVCGVAPSCWNHWMAWVPAHLRCITVTNLLKIRRYRSPVTVWVRRCPSSDQKGPIPNELLTAHHAVHFRLCRGLSLTMSGAIVAQNPLFWVLTLPSS